MKKILFIAFALIMGLSAMAQSGLNWDEYNWVANSNDKFKVQKVEQISEIVNVQKPDFATEDGIYIATRSAIYECTVGSAFDGAGIVLYLTSFTAKETEVTITNAGGPFSFWVYYEDGEGELAEVNVTGVELPATAKVYVGRTSTIAATMIPSNATNKNVTWASDNESVVTVADGVLTGIAEGTANVTVTTEEGGFTATCAVTVTEAPSVEETTWAETDKNVALGCQTWVSAIAHGEKRFITDGDLGSGALQLQVNNSQPVEWAIVDLGYNYDVTKINIATGGDRKDKVYAIYVAPAQDGEVAFADGTDVLADAWTLAFDAEDDFESSAVTQKAFNVNLADVRYIKYVGVERNHNDQWGTGICEIRVAGTTNDEEATKPHHIELSAMPILYSGQSGMVEFTVFNSSNASLEIDPALVQATSSNEAVATVAVADGKITATGIAAGNTTITVNYGELSAEAVLEIHEALTAAPTPTLPEDLVLSLYSDAYPKYDFNWFDWGGCTIERMQLVEGDEVAFIKNWKYLGSQFKTGTDVTEYDYFHIDIFSPVETTVGIVPITQNGEGGNSPERGVTVNLTAYQWNSFDVPMADFIERGVTNLHLLYQIKFNKEIYADGGQLNHDGSFDIFVDNMYFYKDVEVSAKPEFTVNVTFTPKDATSATMNYTIEHTNADDVHHYYIAVTEETAESSMMRAAGRVIAEVNHTDMDNLSGSVDLEGLSNEKSTAIKVTAHAVLNDGTKAAASNAEDPENHLLGSYTVDTTTTGLENISLNANAPVEYFNMQGIKVENPENGVFIRRQGSSVSKVVLR